MRALLVFGFFIVYAFFARWYYVCEIHGLCDGAEVRLHNLSLREGDRLILEGYDQMSFAEGATAPQLNDNNVAFLDEVARYLREYPDKHLTITAFYMESEAGIKSGFFENIGVARAAELRSELMRRGIEEQRIALDYGRSQSESLSEPVLFEIDRPGNNLLFSFTNMTFSQDNFRFDSDEFRPGRPFISYADSVRIYLENRPETELVIIGHTDTQGSDEYNQDLGLRRAKNARQYFIDLGLKADIEVRSMGESSPVATNRTAEGRAKNRRVNFILEADGS